MSMSIKSKLIEIYHHRPIWHEIKQLKEERKDYWEEAVKRFEEEKQVHGSLSEYREALDKNRVAYDEYMLFFQFWRLDKKQWKDYISETEMRCIYRKTVDSSVRGYFFNKAKTLQVFRKYVHRKWISAKDVSFEVFSEFVSSLDCIVKPVYGSLGEGVMKLKKEEPKDLPQLYQYCRENIMIVEEFVTGCEELESFNPPTLNTIRVITISKDGKCEPIAALFRMGRGDQVVDNTSQGGIFVMIDVDSGVTIKEGTDKDGNKYSCHPITGKIITGYRIPLWDKIIEACKELTTMLPEIVFVGWDICLLPNGEVELIEANSTPNVKYIQESLKKGLKPRISALGKEVLGYDPLKLISVWSRSFVN